MINAAEKLTPISVLRNWRLWTAKQLTASAFVLWVLSLLWNSLVSYAHVDTWNAGFSILLLGWLGPLEGNFAWYANVFFMLSVTLLFFNKSAVIPALLAVIISIDTIRYSVVTLNEAGDESIVYGYGWGTVLWFLALCVLLVAAGTRRVERQKQMNGARGWGAFARPLGIVLFAAVVAGTGYFSLHDRIVGNEYERRKLALLNGIAFKRLPVCRIDVDRVSSPLSNFAGVLEVVVAEKTDNEHPVFKSPETLLAWGIPVVRIEGLDYKLSTVDEWKNLLPLKPSMKSTARLEVTEVKDGLYSIRLRLLESSSGRIVFEQIWRNEVRGESIYCPEFKYFPKANEQPRRLILQALGLPNHAN